MLLYQAKYLKKAKKLVPAWDGPYVIHDILSNGAAQLRTLKGELLPLVNSSRLKLYVSLLAPSCQEIPIQDTTDAHSVLPLLTTTSTKTLVPFGLCNSPILFQTLLLFP